MATLLVMRHAKSDWNADYGRDHDRPLNERGRRSARIMGMVLNGEGLAPQHVTSSTAVRARTTVELAAESGAWAAPITLDESLYDGGVDAALEVISGAPDVETIMVVGHQPTWSMLVKSLTAEPADMKTATVAVIELDTDRESGSLRSVLHPRDYLGSEFDR